MENSSSSPACCCGSSEFGTEYMNLEALQKAEAYVAENADAWLAQDLEILRKGPSDDHPSGWTFRKTAHSTPVWHRRDPSGNPNHLFWFKTAVDAEPRVVSDYLADPKLFLSVHRLFTKEYTDGCVLGRAGRYPILYQLFKPGMPLTRDRDLVNAVVRKDGVIGPEGLRGTLISYRSVPYPTLAGRVRLQFHGAHFVAQAPDRNGTLIFELDREDQGGCVSSRIANGILPRFLLLQAEGFQKFFVLDRV